MLCGNLAIIYQNYKIGIRMLAPYFVAVFCTLFNNMTKN